MINTKFAFLLQALIYKNSKKATITEIYNLDNAKEFELVRLDYTDAKSGLISAARGHAEKIVLRLVARHRLDSFTFWKISVKKFSRTHCETIIREFETIKKVAEKEPEDTEELIKIQDAVRKFILSIDFFPEKKNLTIVWTKFVICTKDYIKESKETKLKQLDVDLEGMLMRYVFLLDVHLLNDSDMHRSAGFYELLDLRPVYT